MTLRNPVSLNRSWFLEALGANPNIPLKNLTSRSNESLDVRLLGAIKALQRHFSHQDFVTLRNDLIRDFISRRGEIGKYYIISPDRRMKLIDAFRASNNWVYENYLRENSDNPFSLNPHEFSDKILWNDDYIDSDTLDTLLRFYKEQFASLPRSTLAPDQSSPKP
jgi:hypothetical protein